MGLTARAYDHPRWSYDETLSEAGRRSAARAAQRTAGPSRAQKAQAQAATAPRRSQRQDAETLSRPEAMPALRVVQQPRGRFGSIIVIAALLGLALLTPVGLNSAMRRSQYGIAQLQQRQDDLIAQRSALRAEHASLTSTQKVKQIADQLGMVTPGKVGFIHLSGSTGSSAQAAFDQAAPTVALGETTGSGETLAVASTPQEAATGQ
jgi:hypothetical protein